MGDMKVKTQFIFSKLLENYQLAITENGDGNCKRGGGSSQRNSKYASFKSSYLAHA